MMSNKEKCLSYRKIARAMLKLHDKGQNMLISGELTHKQFTERCDFYRANIERYKDLEEKHAHLSKRETMLAPYMDKDPVAYYDSVPTWREFLNSFHQDGRYCKFSQNALEALYVCLEAEAWDGDENTSWSMEVEQIEKSWTEYECISQVMRAQVWDENQRVSLETLRDYSMVTSTLEELRLRAIVLELANGSLLVQYNK